MARLPSLFEGFNDNCVLVHGNFCLRSSLKTPVAISASGDGRPRADVRQGAEIRTVSPDG